MEIYFVYLIGGSYNEFTKMYGMSNIRIPNIGNAVYYKHDQFMRVGCVDHIFYDYAAMTINVYIKPSDEKVK